MKKLFWIFIALACFASPALAEISTLTDTDAVASDHSLKAFVGFEANNILLVEDGSLYFSIHGGVVLNPNFRLGLYAATVANDVNTKENGKNIAVDYNSLGVLAEHDLRCNALHQCAHRNAGGFLPDGAYDGRRRKHQRPLRQSREL